MEIEEKSEEREVYIPSDTDPDKVANDHELRTITKHMQESNLKAVLSWGVSLDRMYKFEFPYLKICKCNLCEGIIYLGKIDKAQKRGIQKEYCSRIEYQLTQEWLHCKNWSLSFTENYQLIATSQHIEKNRLVTLKVRKDRDEKDGKILIHTWCWAKPIGCIARGLGRFLSKRTFKSTING